MIQEDLYFVDKTLLINEFLTSSAKTTLITRPRRFGKTLNLSMIRRFFEDERTEQGERIDNGSLFDGLKICGCGEDVMKHQQQYPVISLSLKSGKQPDFELAYTMMKRQLVSEFNRHRYILNGNLLTAEQAERYRNCLRDDGERSLYTDALAFLSECLAKYHGRKVFILVDEYDVPLENAYFAGFYEEMIGFIRSLFESALKTNPYLERGVITGCLRISRESIFTGLNNLQIHSVLSPYYCDCFGFTAEEVEECLAYYGLTEKYPELKDWYDGYRFGSAEIYNPWSILNYIKIGIADAQALPKPYWSNTSSNAIIRELVEEADEETRKELEILMDGGLIEKPVHEEITYGDIHTTKDNLWNFLFFTGYLKAGKQRQENETIYVEMSIPNKEITSIYRQSILAWFDRKVRETDRSPLIRALEEGDCQAAEDFISAQLMDTISYFDYPESYYHGFLSGLLKGAGSYTVHSNRESGTGRPDIILMERKFKGRAMVLELKIVENFREMEDRCQEALVQIEENQYTLPLENDGYRPVLKYAVCFFKKGCMVKTSS